MNADQSYAAPCIAARQSQPETIAMNVTTTRNAPFHTLMLLAVATTALLVAPHRAQAATTDADSGQTVECMLPGQIHSVGGHATMGPRRPVQTTPADCRQRGGEYTVPQASMPTPSTPAIAADSDDRVRCLLPKQLRQLGEKKQYHTTRRTIYTTRSNCQTRGGSVIAVSHAKK